MKEEKCHYISQLLVLIVSRFNSFYIYYIHGHKYLWNVLKANECNPKHAKTYFSHETLHKHFLHKILPKFTSGRLNL